MSILSTCCVPCAGIAHRVQKRALVTGSCELPCVCWEPSWHSLQKQEALEGKKRRQWFSWAAVLCREASRLRFLTQSGKMDGPFFRSLWHQEASYLHVKPGTAVHTTNVSPLEAEAEKWSSRSTWATLWFGVSLGYIVRPCYREKNKLKITTTTPKQINSAPPKHQRDAVFAELWRNLGDICLLPVSPQTQKTETHADSHGPWTTELGKGDGEEAGVWTYLWIRECSWR